MRSPSSSNWLWDWTEGFIGNDVINTKLILPLASQFNQLNAALVKSKASTWKVPWLADTREQTP